MPYNSDNVVSLRTPSGDRPPAALNQSLEVVFRRAVPELTPQKTDLEAGDYTGISAKRGKDDRIIAFALQAGLTEGPAVIFAKDGSVSIADRRDRVAFYIPADSSKEVMEKASAYVKEWGKKGKYSHEQVLTWSGQYPKYGIALEMEAQQKPGNLIMDSNAETPVIANTVDNELPGQQASKVEFHKAAEPASVQLLPADSEPLKKAWEPGDFTCINLKKDNSLLRRAEAAGLVAGVPQPLKSDAKLSSADLARSGLVGLYVKPDANDKELKGATEFIKLQVSRSFPLENMLARSAECPKFHEVEKPHTLQASTYMLTGNGLMSTNPS